MTHTMTHTLSSEVATVVRPWGLLTVIALGYAAYTLHTGWPEPVTRPAPRITLPKMQLAVPAADAPRTVVKCVQDGTVTYSDVPCATLFDVIVLPD